MSWKFINDEYTGFVTAGASAFFQNAEDLGFMFYNQKKEIVFRVGNDGSVPANYAITVSGSNSALNAGVEFSKDRKDWEDVVYHSGIQPNAVTDITWCRFIVPSDAFVTSGTFYMVVSEV